jgi:23S rRNA pseudouridine955/2504/2580 synthase
LLDAWGEGLERPRLTHRLDRDTSGVLVLGKSPAAAARLSGAFAKRRAHKTYWALVAGEPKPPKGLIEMPLGEEGRRRPRAGAARRSQGVLGAEPADTDYVTLSRAGHRVTWLALRPTPAAPTSCAPTCWPSATRSWAIPSTATRPQRRLSPG